MSGLKDRNFYIEDGKAYTEDDVLVYNLFIYRVPHWVTKEQIETFFAQFGEVLKIGLNTNRKSRGKPTQTGFVNFKDAKSAVEVLGLKEHKIKKKSFGVKACDTWHQPPPLELFSPETASPLGVYKKPKFEEELSDAGPPVLPSINGVQLTDLNDDCLEHILKFVSLRDQLKFARVSQRFHDIVQMLYKTQYRVLTCDKLAQLTLFEVRDFLILAGPHIEALEGVLPYCDRERILEFIIKYVYDLKRLALQECQMKKFSLRKIMCKFVGLKELHLERCEVDDQTLAIINFLPNLEILNLADNYALVGSNLKRFTQLKELNMSGCLNVDQMHFAAMCTALTELRSLDISTCEQLDGTCLQHMVQHCTKLENVKMLHFNMPMESVARLPNLKSLEVEVFHKDEMRPTYCETLCIALAEHRANQMEVLKMQWRTEMTIEGAQAIGKLKRLRVLHLGYTDINEETIRYFGNLENLQEVDLNHSYTLKDGALLRLLESCKSVRSVNIEYCLDVTNKFVKSAIQLFRNQGRQQPVKFQAYASGLDEVDNLTDKDYLESRSYIDLRFDPINPEYFDDIMTDESLDLDDEDMFDDDMMFDDNDDMSDEDPFPPYFVFHQAFDDVDDLDDRVIWL